MPEVTIANSSQQNRDDIKDIAREDTNLIIGTEIAAHSKLVDVRNRLESLHGQINKTSNKLFRAHISNNTTVAILQPIIGLLYTHWGITKNTVIAPGLGDLNTGSINGTFDLQDWNPVDLRLYVYTNNAVTPIATVDGTYIVTLNPKSSVPPGLIKDFSVIKDGSNSIVAIWSYPLSNAQPLVYDVYANNKLVASNAESGVSINNLTSNIDYTLFVRVTDANSLASISNEDTITLVSEQSGTISIIDAVYEASEASASISLELQILGRTQTLYTSSVQVRTVDDTALDGVNYTGIATQTVTFPANDNSTQTVTIPLLNTTSITNLTAQLHIIPGSETSNDPTSIPKIANYPDNAQLFKILGTGSTEADTFAQADDGAGNNIICCEAENYTSKDDKGQPANVSWITASSTKLDPYGNVIDKGAIGSAITCTSGSGYYIASEAFANAPVLSYKFNFTQLGLHYLWIRAKPVQGWQNKCWVGFNNNDNFSKSEQVIMQISKHGPDLDGTDAKWRWRTFRDEALIPITYNVTSLGTQTFNLIKSLSWNNIDRFAIVDNSTWDPRSVGNNGIPTGSDKVGPPESIKTSLQTATDDSRNLLEPTNPDPGTSILNPVTLVPLSGTINLIIKSGLAAVWEVGTSDIQVIFTVKDINGNEIAGDAIVTNERIVWYPSQELLAGMQHIATIAGTCIDKNNISRSINVSNWTFTMLQTNDSSILYKSNFTNYTSGTPVTTSEMKSVFNRNQYATGSGFGANNDQYAYWRSDPKGIRGTVMALELPPGTMQTNPSGTKVETRIEGVSGQEEVWFSYDIMFSDNFKFGPGFKAFGGMGASMELLRSPDYSLDNDGDGIGDGKDPTGEWCSCRLTCIGDPIENDPSFPIPTWHPYPHIPDGEGTFAAYYYYMERGQVSRAMNKVDPFNRINTAAETPQHLKIQNNKWYNVKMHLKMNTGFVEGSAKADCPANGICRFYIDDKLMWDHGGIVWRNTYANTWDMGYLVHAYGGRTSKSNSPSDRTQTMYLDNVTISTKNIVTDNTAFDNVPVPAGHMNYTWYADAKKSITSTVKDDPIDWVSLYNNALRVVEVRTNTEFQNALTASIPGDVITIVDGTYSKPSSGSFTIGNAGTAINPIVIAPKHKCLGISGSVIFSGSNDRMLNMYSSAKHIILGGFTIRDFPNHAIQLIGGATKNDEGASDIRMTDMWIENIGVNRGTADGTIIISTRCNRVRIDHNVLIYNYNEVTWYGTGVDAKLVATKDGRMDHNYIGPAGLKPTTGWVPGVSYAMKTVGFYGAVSDSSLAHDTLDTVFEYNICDMPRTENTHGEYVYIKLNGITIQNNILKGGERVDYGYWNGGISLRQGHHSIIKNNYIRQLRISIMGSDHIIEDNLIYGDNKNDIGIIASRWGKRKAPNCTFIPEGHDNIIRRNKIYDQLVACMQIGFESYGTFRPIYNYDISNNLMQANQGILSDMNTVDEPARTTDLCAGDVIGDANLSGGVNTNIVWKDNTYLVTGTATIGIGDNAGVPSTTLLEPNFNNYALGLYTESALRKDFKSQTLITRDSSIHGPDYWSMEIVDDPAGGSEHGRVLQVNRRSGLQEYGSNTAIDENDLPNNRGFRFRGDFKSQTEVYLYYETFVPSLAVGAKDWYFPLQHKMLGIINGGLTEATHATGFDPVLGGPGMTSMDQIYGGGWQPDGATAFIGHTNDKAWGTDPKYWTTNPALVGESGSLIPTVDKWQHPRGRWIGRQIKVVLNTGNAVSDGIYEVKIVDPVAGMNGTIVRLDTNLLWTSNISKYKFNGIMMYNYVGGDPEDVRNIFPQEQAISYDNIKVANIPII